MSDVQSILKALSVPTPDERLAALADCIKQHKPTQAKSEFENINNHIHTIYSFSPYSPAAAVYFARDAGLATAGIMDHDSVSGCREFIGAGRIADFPVTCGCELRADFSHTPVAGRRINNPDQNDIVYMALHAIPHNGFDRVDEFLRPIRAARGARNRKMTETLSGIFAPYGVTLDYDRDVLPRSQAADGGSVTERHILCALGENLIAKFGRGAALVAFLRDTLKLSLSEKVTGFLSDAGNIHYDYDLLGLLKAEFVPRFYIPATDECPDVRDVLALSEEVGAISAYAYLGDVGDSVTGDKRAQKFEDDYLDELVPLLKNLGYRAITYMPSRNTPAQLARLRKLCDRYGLLQISGEDINSSRQKFVCTAMQSAEFANLVDAAWALIAHERVPHGLFAPQSIASYPSLDERVAAFAAMGRKLYVR
ncbi:MAG: PHP domain-containing protein [Clostridiaceae bacterium]|nr:PHP domain-containing protein [Clostridiaceae bacterium]